MGSFLCGMTFLAFSVVGVYYVYVDNPLIGGIMGLWLATCFFFAPDPK